MDNNKFYSLVLWLICILHTHTCVMWVHKVRLLTGRRIFKGGVPFKLGRGAVCICDPSVVNSLPDLSISKFFLFFFCIQFRSPLLVRKSKHLDQFGL